LIATIIVWFRFALTTAPLFPRSARAAPVPSNFAIQLVSLSALTLGTSFYSVFLLVFGTFPLIFQIFISVWISDTSNHRVQCYRDADSWLHVRQLGKTDDPGSTPEQFNRPLHMAVADDGRLFVADSLNHRVQMVDAASQRAFVKSIGPIPNKKQLALSSLASPAAVFIAGGVLYIGDSGNHRISAFDVESWQSIGTIGEIGMSPGQFLGIRAVAVDVVDREVFVTDWNGPQAVSVFSSFEIDQGSAQL
jgi:DNA-binding beta-propeller fold protein YncE